MEGNGFFNDQRADLTIVKGNFPKNTLVYVNDGTITPVKGGNAMYFEFAILAQIMPVANPPPDLNLDTYKFQENEVLFINHLKTLKMAYIGVLKRFGIYYFER